MSYWTCPVVGAREICVDGECFFGDHELPDLCHVHNEEVATLTAERDDWRDRCTEAQAERDAAREERDELKVQRDQLGQWVHDLQSGMYINCVYCGHRYGPNDEVPATMADALKDHVEQCPKHPMSALKAKCDELRRRLDAVVKECSFGALPSDRLAYYDRMSAKIIAIAEGREP